MNRLHRRLAALVPSSRSEWIRAHEAELQVVEDRWQRWQWALGLVPLVGWALASQLRQDPRKFLGGFLMKTITATSSILTIAAAISLAVLYVYVTDPNRPLLLLGLSVALLIQGSYTLAFILGLFRSHNETARHLQLTGSTLALAVGTVGFATGFLANIDPVNNDPEYGPMTIALLIAAHGLTSLLAFTPQRPVNSHTPTQ